MRRAVTFPVDEVLETPPSSTAVHQAADYVGLTSADDAWRWGRGRRRTQRMCDCRLDPGHVERGVESPHRQGESQADGYRTDDVNHRERTNGTEREFFSTSSDGGCPLWRATRAVQPGRWEQVSSSCRPAPSTRPLLSPGWCVWPSTCACTSGWMPPPTRPPPLAPDWETVGVGTRDSIQRGTIWKRMQCGCWWHTPPRATVSSRRQDCGRISTSARSPWTDWLARSGHYSGGENLMTDWYWCQWVCRMPSRT